ncbi:MAG TPA: hypothetical protein VJS66_05520 [Burkholderiales bacterium]|nr:hypothetical protein [Burkholderiales bacterium]
MPHGDDNLHETSGKRKADFDPPVQSDPKRQKERSPPRQRSRSRSPRRDPERQKPTSTQERAPAPANPPFSISFEASGDASRPLAYAQSLDQHRQNTSGFNFDMQVGMFEKRGELMGGTRDNIEQLQKIPGVRVTYGRDAREPPSPTHYDAVAVTNIMAVGSGGKSDTSVGPNRDLMERVIAAQAQKLKPGGQLHIGASGRPYFKPTDHRKFDDRVDVDKIASQNKLQRRPSQEYADQFKVKKNLGERDVGVHGTYTRVYSGQPDSTPLPVPMPASHPATQEDRGERRPPPRHLPPPREPPRYLPQPQRDSRDSGSHHSSSYRDRSPPRQSHRDRSPPRDRSPTRDSRDYDKPSSHYSHSSSSRRDRSPPPRDRSPPRHPQSRRSRSPDRGSRDHGKPQHSSSANPYDKR